MTVRELRKILNSFDENAKVVAGLLNREAIADDGARTVYNIVVYSYHKNIVLLRLEEPSLNTLDTGTID